jgi:hypothetical protein
MWSFTSWDTGFFASGLAQNKVALSLPAQDILPASEVSASCDLQKDHTEILELLNEISSPGKFTPLLAPSTCCAFQKPTKHARHYVGVRFVPRKPV